MELSSLVEFKIDQFIHYFDGLFINILIDILIHPSIKIFCWPILVLRKNEQEKRARLYSI